LLNQRGPTSPCALASPRQKTRQAEELRSEVESSKADAAELDELRELKADIERKERQQAAIIEGQARGGTHGQGLIKQ
jgi:hypothetical protein